MGEHPEMENDHVQRDQPARRGDRLSPLVVAGFVALIILVVVIIL